jgi:hypothetical protein
MDQRNIDLFHFIEDVKKKMVELFKDCRYDVILTPEGCQMRNSYASLKHMYNSLHDLLTSYWPVLSSDNDWEGSNLDDSDGDNDDDDDFVARKMATLVDTASLTALGLSVMSENLTLLLQIDGKPMLPQSLMGILKTHFVDKKAQHIPDHNSMGIKVLFAKR